MQSIESHLYALFKAPFILFNCLKIDTRIYVLISFYTGIPASQRVITPPVTIMHVKAA